MLGGLRSASSVSVRTTRRTAFTSLHTNLSSRGLFARPYHAASCCGRDRCEARRAGARARLYSAPALTDEDFSHVSPLPTEHASKPLPSSKARASAGTRHRVLRQIGHDELTQSYLATLPNAAGERTLVRLELLR